MLPPENMRWPTLLLPAYAPKLPLALSLAGPLFLFTLQGAAGPMFPDEDEWMHEEWDEYGAPIHKEDFMVTCRAFMGIHHAMHIICVH